MRATLVDMPKRISIAKLDTVQNAFRVVQESVGAAPTTPAPNPSVISQVMAEMGRKGGKVGGKRRLETMTAERRREVASMAAKKRWSKAKKD